MHVSRQDLKIIVIREFFVVRANKHPGY